MNGEITEGPDKVLKYLQEVVVGLVGDCVKVSEWKMAGAGLTWKVYFCQVKGED